MHPGRHTSTSPWIPLCTSFALLACGSAGDRPEDTDGGPHTFDAAPTVDADLGGDDAGEPDADAPLTVDAALPTTPDVGPPPPPVERPSYTFPGELLFCLERPPPSPGGCANRVLDGDETGVDCGGSCGHACSSEQRCERDGDCPRGEQCRRLLCPSDAPCPRACVAPRERCVEGLDCSTECAEQRTLLPDGSFAPSVYFCEPRHVAGEPCRRGDRVCADGTFCGPTDPDRPRDATFRCLPRAEQDRPCVRDRRESCVEGLTCLDGACAAPRATGSACLGSSECAEGDHCAAGVCTRRGGPGGFCASTLSEECSERTRCAIPGDGRDMFCTCEGAEGDPCILSSCGAGLECALPAGECRSNFDCDTSDCCMVSGRARCVPWDSGARCEIPVGTCAPQTL